MATVRWYSVAARGIVSAVEPRIAPFMAELAGAPILCGRGDKRTKKGKRFKGSFGNSRPNKDKKIERMKDKIEVPRSTSWPLPFKLI